MCNREDGEHGCIVYNVENGYHTHFPTREYDKGIL
jgi:hypothetical protein